MKIAKCFAIGLVAGLLFGFCMFGCFDSVDDNTECSSGNFKCEGTEIYFCDGGYWLLDDDCAMYGEQCTTDCYYGGIACCR